MASGLCYVRLSVKEREVFFWPWSASFWFYPVLRPLASAEVNRVRKRMIPHISSSRRFSSERCLGGCARSTLSSPRRPKHEPTQTTKVNGNPFRFQPICVAQPSYDKWVLLTALWPQTSK